MPPSLTLSHCDHYSSLHAARRLPLVDAADIVTEEALENVELEVEFTPAFVSPLRWKLARLAPGSHRLEGSCTCVDPRPLAQLGEATPGQGRARLLQGREVLAESSFSFCWLPPCAWAGRERYPELLASLVQPRDQAVECLMHRAAELLQEQGLPPVWRGYRAERFALVNRVHALWNALQELPLSLQPCRWSGLAEGLPVRTPSQILHGSRCSVLDAALYLAAALAQVGLHPLLALLPGHVLVGVMLREAFLPAPLETRPQALEELLAQEHLLLLDVGGLSSGVSAQSFENARAAAARLLEAPESAAECLGFDLTQLWESGFQPYTPPGPPPARIPANALPWPGRAETAPAPAGSFLPEITEADREQALSLVNTRNRTRMERWQLKLLDLSLRNNLLNARIDRSQIPLLIPNVAELEDALTRDRKFSICHLPDAYAALLAQSGRDSGADDVRQELMPLAQSLYARQQLLSLDKASEGDERKLERRVKALCDKARKVMEESGCNTLNLACGFLKWIPRAHADRVLYAPLLLVPVALRRMKKPAGYKLCTSEEEPCINLTLLELLKNEFGLRIPELEGELPHDAAGVDVEGILRLVREAVRDFPGWEVLEDCTLGMFSFAKYLMWRDLRDRQASLMANPIVSHLAESKPTPFPAQIDFPTPGALDAEADAKRIFTPLSADSSQLAAVLAAARGKNFVLIGPPGTGKSQTIANMIAHSLGQGKTVLFVAEKAAALSVVYKRLRRIGLGDYCLELHSNKASRRLVLDQFSAAREQSKSSITPTRWEQVVKKLLRLRTQLNALPEALHHPYADGGSLYEDIGFLADSAPHPTFAPISGDSTQLTSEQHESLLSEASVLSRRFAPVADLLPGAGDLLRHISYTTTWEQELADALAQHVRLLERWQEAFVALLRELGMDPQAYSPHGAELECLCLAAREHPGQDLTALLPARAFHVLARMRQELALAGKYQDARRSLSLDYPESALDEPQLDQWLREWKVAHVSNFFSRFFAQRRIRKNLRLLAFSRQKPDALADLTNLLAMRAARDELRASLAADGSLPQYRKGVEMTQAQLEAAEQLAANLQQVSHLTALAEAWLGGHSPMAPGSPALGLHTHLQECRAEIRAHESTLARLLGAVPPAFEGHAEAALARVAELAALRDRWHELVLWNRQAAESRTGGHGLLVEALLAHKVAPEQLRDACEWNLRVQRTVKTIDDSSLLSHFDHRTQEGTIEDFAQQDAHLLTTAASQLLASLTEKAAGINKPEYKTELGRLDHEISKKGRFIAPRALLNQTPHVSRLLKPCMLMSPLSVAQYLNTESEPFDVVIFDEASQIPVWDAIGVIGRGSSAVIVGDPRQMPPTSFFAKGNTQEEDEEEEDALEDMESILDECIACGIPTLNLAWHYRSKSESLIAFSNHNYYEGKLTTFPAPVTQDKALQYHYVGGTYQKGAKRTNPEEARALVRHVVDTLHSPGFRYTELTSIGIVTFNATQQALIEDLLEEERLADESLEPYFSEANPEAIFVKNLENVQGDERGCIYFSTTYGPDERGAIAMNFGPLNNQGGERRLNVAITRSRATMHVFTSLRPEDINLNRTSARGVVDLRHFLECASMGVASYFSLVAPARAETLRHQLASVIARRLEEKGWRCQTHVGVSEFRIDIAVEQPQHAGAMLAGIMLDGPSYRAANTARDRDLLRPGVLTGLGWRLLRLWALDWWRNPAACLRRLDAQLRNLSEQGPPVMPELPSLVEETVDS